MQCQRGLEVNVILIRVQNEIRGITKSMNAIFCASLERRILL